jgi:hypothetical protein
LLQDVPLAVRQRLWFQNEGAAAYYGEDVRQLLNATYRGRWIASEGSNAGPPQSPDLTPMDFFLWGHLKEHVYALLPRTIEDLVARLEAAVTTVDGNM